MNAPVVEGDVIAGKYRVDRVVGRGGMGIVVAASHLFLPQRVAIKLLLSDENPRLVQRFLREARAVVRLKGEHVVRVFDVGQLGSGVPYIVMEYLEGEDLAARLGRVGRLDAPTTYRIVAQVARALNRAHGLGIIHRDIKPANVFLVPGEEQEIAKVLDFGIAKHRSLPNAFEDPLEASLIGTPCYMSPEQATAQGVDHRSDLWALAVIAFECLTGSPPFQHESVTTVLTSVIGGNVPSLLAVRPDLPEAVEAWWRRATAKNVAERFQSARELADALGEALHFPKLPISRPARAGVAATTLLFPADLPGVEQPSTRVEQLRAHRTSQNVAVTLHAAGNVSRAEYQRAASPARRRRRLSLAAAAISAAAGFAAASLRTEINWAAFAVPPAASASVPELHAAKPDEPAPVSPTTEAASPAAPAPEPAIAPPPPAAAAVAQANAVIPVALVRPKLKVAPPRPFTTSLDEHEPRLATPDTAAPRRALAEPASVPDADEDPPPRVMPPGEKDYGI